MSTYIVAEAGVNHNGSVDLALQLIDAAKTAGADAVKFQTFQSESVVSRNAVKADYQLAATGSGESQLEMVKRLEFDLATHLRLVDHCKQRGIEFLSTPFDEQSVDMLVHHLGVSRIKIPSGEITNALLLLKIAGSGKPAILSTGMSGLGDIEAALGVLAFGYLRCDGKPGAAAFAEAYQSVEGRKVLSEKVYLLHCTTEYPAPFIDVNLKAMKTLQTAFGLPVGYSDHTVGIAVPIAAVALGAVIIEKHLTLDRGLPGPDHLASLEPEELSAMVKAIREIELALGSTTKFVTPSEAKNQAIARKSLVAARPIARGELFTAENITAKRPGTGVSPMHFWTYAAARAARDYAADELIDAHAN